MCLFQPRRPTWFEDETVAKTAAEPMHGLRLIIKEDVLPLSDHPKFEALAEVAKRGLLAPETCFFPFNAFMASARSSNTFNCMLQNRIN